MQNFGGMILLALAVEGEERVESHGKDFARDAESFFDGGAQIS